MIRRKWMWLLLVGLILVASSTQPVLADGNINFLFGQKKLDSGDWEPVDEQTEFGIMLDFKGANWPISIAFDFLIASDEETVSGIDFESDTREFNIGIRKYIPVADVMSAYIGGGVASISAELTGRAGGGSASVDDSAVGFWLGGGLLITTSDVLNLGIDFRYSKAEVTFFDIEGEAGGTHLLAFLGFRF